MKITVTSKMALIAYVLWIAVGICAGAYVRGGPRGAAMTAMILALIACTVHIRTGQRRVANEVGAMIRVTHPGPVNVTSLQHPSRNR